VKKEKPKEEPSSQFQRQRVDMLLGELVRKFPVPQAGPPEQPNKTDEDKAVTSTKPDGKAEATPVIKQEPMDTNTNDSVSSQPQIKQEPLSGPPEKKIKLNS
jgi:mediator of RNA polymerase II transcription subunit 6